MPAADPLAFDRTMPPCLRSVVVSDLLPELLHDINNACAVLDGISLLLESEAREPRKVSERSQGIAKAGDSLSKTGWLANGLVAALGAPLSFPDREDGLALVEELVASSLERRGGRLTFLTPASSIPMRGSLDKIWLGIVLRAFAGRDTANVRVGALDGEPAALRLEAEGSASEPGFADAAAWLARHLDAAIEVGEGSPRTLLWRPRQP
jgi:hypothetical protein